MNELYNIEKSIDFLENLEKQKPSVTRLSPTKGTSANAPADEKVNKKGKFT